MNRVILVFATLLAASATIGIVAAEDVVTMDENTPLSHDRTLDEWQETGNVTVQPTQLNMTITLAEEPEDAGLSGLQYIGTTSYYLRVEYNEDLSRTIRFYVPGGYWTPYPDSDVSAEESDVTAEYSPTAENEHTAVSMDVDGQTDAVFVVNRRAAWTFSARHQGNELVENTTGIDVPTFSAGQQWQYLDDEDFGSDRGRAAIESDGDSVVIQYDAGPGNETRWENARECSGSERRVCTFTVDGDQQTYVLSRSAEAPRVRYKVDGGFMDRLRGSWSELVGLTDRDGAASDGGWFPW